MSHPSYMGLYLVHVAIKPYKVDPGLPPLAFKDFKGDNVLHLSLTFFFYLKYLKLHTRFFLGSTHPSTFFCSYIRMCWCTFICCCIDNTVHAQSITDLLLPNYNNHWHFKAIWYPSSSCASCHLQVKSITLPSVPSSSCHSFFWFVSSLLFIV